jgi:hypothetical protein
MLLNVIYDELRKILSRMDLNQLGDLPFLFLVSMLMVILSLLFVAFLSSLLINEASVYPYYVILLDVVNGINSVAKIWPLRFCLSFEIKHFVHALYSCFDIF